MKKSSFFFLLLTSFNVLSVEVDGSGIDSSSQDANNQNCVVINVGDDGIDAKTEGDGSNVKTIVVCKE